MEDTIVPQNSLTVDLFDANKGKEGAVIDSVSLVKAPPPIVGDFPDGGLTAWLVVVGVGTARNSAYIALTSADGHPGRARYIFYVRPRPFFHRLVYLPERAGLGTSAHGE